MRNAGYSKVLAAVLVGLFFVPTIFSQSAKGFIYQKKIEYEVTSSGTMNVTYREGCDGLQLLTVYVDPKAATEDKIKKFVAEISSAFPVTYDLMIIFSVDRSSKSFFEQDDAEFLKNVRGFYGRKAGVSKLFAFPNGTTEQGFDEAMSVEEKDTNVGLF